jgi:N-acetylneuraminic acid mutarotase
MRAFWLVLLPALYAPAGSAGQGVGGIAAGGLSGGGLLGPAVAWSIVATLPVDSGIGLSGLFAGISNGVLLTGGGSNFPGAAPSKGGVKRYYDKVYVLSRAGHFHWIPSTFRLPEAAAYGGSAEVPEGVVCVGGENEKGFIRSVFLLRWEGRVRAYPLPSLPFGLACAAVTAIGHTVFVAGGECASGSTDVFMSLDLSQPAPVWHTLSALPLRIAYGVAVAQSGCVYVLGGRTRTASGVSTLHSSVFCYDPVTGRWKKETDIPVHVSAACAVSYGTRFIRLIGGDHGEIFTQLEQLDTAIARHPVPALVSRKQALLDRHPGFSREIYVYDTVTDTWKKKGSLPMPCPVTTLAVKWGNDIGIPGGEIKPGVRTSSVILGKQ